MPPAGASRPGSWSDPRLPRSRRRWARTWAARGPRAAGDRRQPAPGDGRYAPPGARTPRSAAAGHRRTAPRRARRPRSRPPTPPGGPAQRDQALDVGRGAGCLVGRQQVFRSRLGKPEEFGEEPALGQELVDQDLPDRAAPGMRAELQLAIGELAPDGRGLVGLGRVGLGQMLQQGHARARHRRLRNELVVRTASAWNASLDACGSVAGAAGSPSGPSDGAQQGGLRSRRPLGRGPSTGPRPAAFRSGLGQRRRA